MASASSAKLVMTSIPTRNSVQAIDRRGAMFSPLWQAGIVLTQETFDVLIIGPPQQFVGSFKNNFSVAKQEETRVRDADKIIFGLELNSVVTVRRVLGCERERVAHAMRDKDA